MARIKESTIERLKTQVSLESLIRAKGIELKAHGENLLGHCPFHDDRTPSLVVTPVKNLWHCMGACQVGGSVIDWVMRMEKVSFRHAVELLLVGDKNILAVEKPRLHAPKLQTTLDVDHDDKTLLKRVVEFYHETLLSRGPEGLEYLEKRGLNSLEMIKYFKLGLSNRTLGLRLPESRVEEGGELRARLMKLGVYRESGHEFFSGSVVIPVIDEEGLVTEIYGRKITPNLREGTLYHQYLPGPHRGVFNPAGLGHEVILCESLIDALSFWVHGFKNVTSSYGVEGFTKDHFEAFEKYGVKKVFIAYDRDEAGDRAAEKLSKKLFARGIETLRIKFPRGMDANDYVLKMKPERSALQLLVASAEYLEKLPVKKKTPEPAAPESFVMHPPTPLRGPEPPPLLPEIKTPVFKRPVAELEADIQGEDVWLRLSEREYRVRGLRKNLSYEVMKVNLRVCSGERFYVDTLDLYQAKARASFIFAAHRDMGVSEEVLKSDLGRVLLKLEELQDVEIRSVLSNEKIKKEVELTDAEKEEALGMLKSPNLLDLILEDFTKSGVVGEESNKLVGYLAAISRKLEDPLAVIIQSASSAGKSSLMEAILAFVPEEDRVKYSAMTGQSLFYMGEKDLKHKILAIAEEQGAMASSYALKLLQSEGEISIASTGKNSQTGKLVTHEYRVEGPVMIFLTTTSVEVDEELINRALVLTVNETREQTRQIHERQRRGQTLSGLLERQSKERIIERQKNMQRLVRPLLVANPFAERLTFLDNRTRSRRDHMKYLTLIRSIALLHQHQREVKSLEHEGCVFEYIEVEPRDIEVANHLCHQVLGRSLDELPPQTRKLLTMMSAMVSEESDTKNILKRDYRFNRRVLREYTGWSDFQVQVHVRKLVELEYVLVHRGGRGQSFVYELLFDASETSGEPIFIGLMNPSELFKNETTMELTHNFKHQTGSIEGSNSTHVAHMLMNETSSETESHHEVEADARLTLEKKRGAV